MNLQLASSAGGGDWLLVHLAVDYITIAIVRDGALIFYRHRGADGDESLADLVHQTAMYYEDRLSGRGFGRVLVAGASNGPDGAAGGEGLRRSLEQRLGARVEAVDPRARRHAHRSHRRLARAAGSPGAACRDSRAGAGGMSLRTNLATRPFYNERAVQAAVLGGGRAGRRGDGLQRLAAGLAHAAGIARWRRVRRRRRTRADAAPADRAGAVGSGRRAPGGGGRGRARGQCRHRRPDVLVDGGVELARDQRCRPTCASPRSHRGPTSTAASCSPSRSKARASTAIDTFLSALEGTGRFDELLVRQERETDEGTIEADGRRASTSRARRRPSRRQERPDDRARLIARVLVERRRVLLPLGIAALVNLGVYVLVVYPLSLKVASSERRATAARMQLAAAERDEKTTRASLGPRGTGRRRPAALLSRDAADQHRRRRAA